MITHCNSPEKTAHEVSFINFVSPEPEAARAGVRHPQPDDAGADEGEGGRRLPRDGLQAAALRGLRRQGHAGHEDRRLGNGNNR